VQTGKFVKILNLSIAVLLVVLVGSVYWLAYRPLPVTSGTLSAPVSKAASIAHDARGVPHIDAASIEDALFLQGFVTAQNRMWQMDVLRRLAAGNLSEIIGKSTLEADRASRRLRLRRIAEASVNAMSPADRAILEAYARGVNYYLATFGDRLPIEFHLLGYKPKPWRPVDSVLCALQMYRTLTNTWRDDLAKQVMFQEGDRDKVDFLFPSRTGHEVQPGSNAWVISGAHTATGKPILANDPHLDYTIPSTWYMVHLKAPGLNVTGVSLPGLPAVIIGHNERIAWGVTNLGFDVQDLYVEKLDTATGRYEFEGKIEQAVKETEEIPVRNEKPVAFSQWVTRHGPVILSEGKTMLSLRWTANDAGAFAFPFLDIDRAANWGEFKAALRRFPGPAQNFVYADAAGNIGYHATGRLPIRRNFEGDLPVDGSSGTFEWEGYIPFDELPEFFNPPSGIIVTANQNPFPVNYKYSTNGGYSTPYRSNQIRALLSAREGWKPADMLAVQTDVYSPFCHFLARQLVAAYDAKLPKDADLAKAAKILRAWNGQMEIRESAPLIVSLTYARLKNAIARAASPHRGDIYNFEMAPSVVQAILETGAKGWFTDKNETLLKLLTGAIAEGKKAQGGNLARWDYGRSHSLAIVHPVDSRIPLFGRFFNIGPFPMSGSSTSVKQVSGALGPSMRFIADPSNWDNSLNNITIGQSGHILSPHYRDQWKAYYYGRSFPMRFGWIDKEQILNFTPR
jgi:penicillin amidase